MGKSLNIESDHPLTRINCSLTHPYLLLYHLSSLPDSYFGACHTPSPAPTLDNPPLYRPQIQRKLKPTMPVTRSAKGDAQLVVDLKARPKKVKKKVSHSQEMEPGS